MSERRQIVDLDFVRGLIEAVDGSGVDSLEISRGATQIRISKSPVGTGAAAPPPQAAPAPAAAPPAPAAAGAPLPGGGAAPAPPPEPADNGWKEIKSPMVGTFYRSPSPEAPSYVEAGSRVAKGQTLCILEAMKLMNELEAEISGVVREVCVDNAEPVEYGQVLFRIEPDA